MKVQISIDDDLMNKIDVYAEKNYMSRSSLFAVAANEYVNARAYISAMQDIALAYQEIAKKNKLDDDAMAELEKINILVYMFRQGIGK